MFCETDKKYFRIAKESTFLCKTKWFPEDTAKRLKEAVWFHCTMQIDDDINRTLHYQKDPLLYWFSHPKSGVDVIKNETMHIDILVDEKAVRQI